MKLNDIHVVVYCLLQGAPLWKILQAGEWRSPAFLKYLDLHCLDKDLVMQTHVGESDSEEEG